MIFSGIDFNTARRPIFRQKKSFLDVGGGLLLVKHTKNNTASIKIANIWLWLKWDLLFDAEEVSNFQANLRVYISNKLSNFRAGTWVKSPLEEKRVKVVNFSKHFLNLTMIKKKTVIQNLKQIQLVSKVKL